VSVVDALVRKVAEDIQAQRVGEEENTAERVLAHAAAEVALGARGVDVGVSAALEAVCTAAEAGVLIYNYAEGGDE
jgi:hypothetical protein